MRYLLPALLALTSFSCAADPLDVTESTETQALRRKDSVHARIATSGFTSCAIVADGRVKCFGENTSGQLGDGTFTDRTTPVFVQSLTNVIDIAVTPTRALALDSDGTVWQWGLLESGSATSPQQVAGLTDAIELMGGGASPCALRGNGTVSCWGTLAGTTTTTSTPTPVSGLTNVVALTKASSHCAVLSNGTVKCWGSNTYGQLGNGSLTPSATPVTVSGIANAVAVAGGPYHACALLATGAIKCWGRNNDGQLGSGVFSSFSTTPVSVSGIATAKSIAAGMSHTCAVLGNGGARCWGEGANGQLGDGNDFVYATPQVVEVISNVVDIASDADTSVALLASGGLRSWGRGTHGALGDGGTPESLYPVVVSGLFDKYVGLRVSAGISNACALLPTGRVKCWGRNHRGQLGNGTKTNSLTPVYFGSLTNLIDVSADESATCAVRGDGTVWCAGDSLYVNSTTPVQLPALSNVAAIHIYGPTGCVLLTTGGVKCFGLGPLGNGTNTSSATPVSVTGLTDAVSVAVGNDFRCAIRAGGTAQCWGNNSWGQLGNGTTAQSLVPATVKSNAVSAVTNIAALSAGGGRACLALGTGVVRCWGAGLNGLGTGVAMPDVNVYPVAVSGLTDAVDVSVGHDNMCALRLGGGIRCWGRGGFLGAGETSDQLAPVDVGGATPLTGAVQMASSLLLTCAALANGSAVCWGDNSYGQVGTGSSGSVQNLPVAVLGL